MPPLCTDPALWNTVLDDRSRFNIFFLSPAVSPAAIKLLIALSVFAAVCLGTIVGMSWKIFHQILAPEARSPLLKSAPRADAPWSHHTIRPVHKAEGANRHPVVPTEPGGYTKEANKSAKRRETEPLLECRSPPGVQLERTAKYGTMVRRSGQRGSGALDRPPLVAYILAATFVPPVLAGVGDQTSAAQPSAHISAVGCAAAPRVLREDGPIGGLGLRLPLPAASPGEPNGSGESSSVRPTNMFSAALGMLCDADAMRWSTPMRRGCPDALTTPLSRLPRAPGARGPGLQTRGDAGPERRAKEEDRAGLGERRRAHGRGTIQVRAHRGVERGEFYRRQGWSGEGPTTTWSVRRRPALAPLEGLSSGVRLGQ
ncbi:uncharacterized protein BXZ73DRAFT_82380 [Epithele typhae]|uniref:uncharacterized protein n=1 Tax=Epithele typhae TaxID=378194 RepID=UPI002008ABDD|nr:uncharacterized protein BXZ73DRAFT_82380 [Epithele typhae]KAH9912305.1 hypothetical protein BXZ73DRAFT_82380 [Epithele typhae]